MEGNRLRLKCDGTSAETRFRLSPKWTSPFKSAGASVLSTAGSRGVRISGSNTGYNMFRGSVKSTGYPLRSPVSPSLPLPCVTACLQVSTRLYHCHNIKGNILEGNVEHMEKEVKNTKYFGGAHWGLLLLVFSPWASLGRNQSPVRRLAWFWYAAS